MTYDRPIYAATRNGEVNADWGLSAEILFTATPHVFVTQVIIAINAVIFALMAATGHGILRASASRRIYRWGAGYGPATTNGQPWRLFTEMWLHFGIIHIGMNMYRALASRTARRTALRQSRLRGDLHLLRSNRQLS